uniref:Uncharacterized protein n=1 Tax=Panagrolaimus sp. PS1159 TaxID=55785 RepID=A0AC35FYL6_9BILA
MTTKDNFLSSKNKQQSFVNNSKNINQYSNLNLNQCYKSLNLAFPNQSYSNTNNDKKLVCLNDERKRLQTWNKSAEIEKSLNALNVFKSNGKIEKEIKNGLSNITNKSTLSLHISTYENPVKAESDLFFGDKNDEILNKQSKKSKNEKQAFIDSKAIIQNPFEFPRQQESDDERLYIESEVSQFKASQSLLNPNVLSPASNKSEKLVSSQKENIEGNGASSNLTDLEKHEEKTRNIITNIYGTLEDFQALKNDKEHDSVPFLSRTKYNDNDGSLERIAKIIKENYDRQKTEVYRLRLEEEENETFEEQKIQFQEWNERKRQHEIYFLAPFPEPQPEVSKKVLDYFENQSHENDAKHQYDSDEDLA